MLPVTHREEPERDHGPHPSPRIAHLRRTHPHTFAGVVDNKPKSHRLMRRGIPYGRSSCAERTTARAAG
nr:hypothetical protein [Streptomyces sp. TLI_235]